METKIVITGTASIPLRHVKPSMFKAYTYTVQAYNGVEDKITSYTQTGQAVAFSRNLQKLRQFCTLPFEYQTTEVPMASSIDYAEWFSPYTYQKHAIEEIVAHFGSDVNVLFEAPTRWGKTAGALGIVKALNQRTLVLVDKVLLRDQFVNDWRTYTNGAISIEVLDQNNKHAPAADIVVSTFQFINKNRDFLENHRQAFGTLIVDELHVSAASTFKAIIENFPVRYRLGMTATPTRSSDGLTPVLTDIFGEVKVIGENPDNMQVHWKEVRLPLHYKALSYAPAKSYERFFLQPEVQQAIIAEVLQHKGKTIMLATGSQLVQNHYAELLAQLGLTTVVFNSEAGNKRTQDANLQRVNDGEVDAFLGLQVMLKGVSIPRLEVIINMMAIGSIENTTQLVGRLKTKFDGKGTPLFITLAPKFGNYKSDAIRGFLSGMKDVVPYV